MTEIQNELPVVAILRGVGPNEVEAIGKVLYEHSVRCIEVPLNSPNPLESIGLLRERMPADCTVGAGTVLTADDVRAVASVGGQLIVTPNIDHRVIKAALDAGLDLLPGFATPTEAFEAIRLGVTGLKLFPASTYGKAHLRALRAVLPKQIRVFAVGGVAPNQISAWMAAGASGIGMASELYRPGDSADDVKVKIKTLVAAVTENAR